MTGDPEDGATQVSRRGAEDERAVLAFGEFVADPTSHRLFHQGAVVAVGERSLSTLLALLEKPGEVFSKARLLDRVWPDAVVGEESLTKAISELRAALGDSANAPQFIQTVHRRGYRFIGEVKAIELEPGPSAKREFSWRWRWAIAAGLVGTAVIAGAVLFGGGASDPPPFGRSEIERLPYLPRSTFKPAFANGSKLLAAVVADPVTDEHALWLIAPGSEEPLRLTRGIEVRGPAPVFSADDTAVLFTAYRHDPSRGLVPAIFRVPVLGGPVRPMLDGVSAVSPSPDGSRLACARVTDRGTSIVVRAEDGRERMVAEIGFWPRWSPDGRWIAYTTSDPEGGGGHLWIVRPDGSGRRCLTTNPGQHYGLDWGPDSRWLYFASAHNSVGNVFAVSIEGGEIHQVTSGPGECSAPTVSPGGRQLVFSYGVRSTTVYRSDDLASPPERILGGEPVHDLALSPQGDRLAVVLGDQELGRRIAVLDLPGGLPRTVSGLDASHVRWAPDGEALYATAASPDQAATWIWRVPVDGRLPAPAASGEHHWRQCDPAPTGAKLAAVRRLDSRDELVVLDLSDGDLRVLVTSASIAEVRWSPDGAFIAFSGGYRPADALSSGIWVVSASGGSPQRLSPDGSWPAWLGNELVFARSTDLSGLWQVALDRSGPWRISRPVEDAWGYSIEGVDLGPGGSPLVLRLVTGQSSLHRLELDQ